MVILNRSLKKQCKWKLEKNLQNLYFFTLFYFLPFVFSSKVFCSALPLRMVFVILRKSLYDRSFCKSENFWISLYSWMELIFSITTASQLFSIVDKSLFCFLMINYIQPQETGAQLLKTTGMLLKTFGCFIFTVFFEASLGVWNDKHRVTLWVWTLVRCSLQSD